MRIAIVQENFLVGDFEKNSQIIISAIENAKAAAVDLIIFPELCLCGYPPRDFLDFTDFIERSYKALDKITHYCDGIATIIGAPAVNPKIEGKDLFNSAWFIADKKVQKIIHKTLLPTYDVFDEYRYFEPNMEFSCIKFKEHVFAVTICEDLWNVESNPMYRMAPMDKLIQHHPDCIINIAASPFHYEQSEKRKHILKANATKYHLPVIYVNQVGAQTELVFDGGSMIVDKNGEVVTEFNYFKSDFSIFEINKSEITNTAKNAEVAESKIQRIYDALVMGVQQYFEKLHFQKAILGLSGGIDSAVVAAIAVAALGKENVVGLMLPSRFSSDHSIADAVQLAKNLGMPYEIVSIEESFEAMEATLKPHFQNLPFNVTEENIQARMRAVILMAFSNKFGYILLNTSNKSEAAVGYGTLYGDMCGGISVLGDVYKTQVYELAKIINKEKEIIPQNTINKPPSAELRPNQKDSDSLPEYEILDKILYLYIEKCKGPNEIIAEGFDAQIVNKALRLVNINEYKRYQTPPILRVSPKAFGSGRRLPIVAKYLL